MEEGMDSPSYYPSYYYFSGMDSPNYYPSYYYVSDEEENPRSLR